MLLLTFNKQRIKIEFHLFQDVLFTDPKKTVCIIVNLKTKKRSASKQQNKWTFLDYLKANKQSVLCVCDTEIRQRCDMYKKQHDYIRWCGNNASSICSEAFKWIFQFNTHCLMSEKRTTNDSKEINSRKRLAIVLRPFFCRSLWQIRPTTIRCKWKTEQKEWKKVYKSSSTFINYSYFWFWSIRETPARIMIDFGFWHLCNNALVCVCERAFCLSSHSIELRNRQAQKFLPFVDHYAHAYFLLRLTFSSIFHLWIGIFGRF